MRLIRTVDDIDECRSLWKQLMPTELVSDLWEVRACFQEQYRHSPRFVVAEEGGVIKGFLPMSWNEETEQYNYFPGETWEGKTWLEQNRIIADSRDTLRAMLASLDSPYHLRYLRSERSWGAVDETIDETGYLFLPEPYGYDMDRYFEAFSHKTSKKLRKELDAWQQRKIDYRYDSLDDFETLCQMNRSRFGRLSYFYDDRFLSSFRSLTSLL